MWKEIDKTQRDIATKAVIFKDEADHTVEHHDDVLVSLVSYQPVYSRKIYVLLDVVWYDMEYTLYTAHLIIEKGVIKQQWYWESERVKKRGCISDFFEWTEDVVSKHFKVKFKSRVEEYPPNPEFAKELAELAELEVHSYTETQEHGYGISEIREAIDDDSYAEQEAYMEAIADDNLTWEEIYFQATYGNGDVPEQLHKREADDNYGECPCCHDDYDDPYDCPICG